MNSYEMIMIHSNKQTISPFVIDLSIYLILWRLNWFWNFYEMFNWIAKSIGEVWIRHCGICNKQVIGQPSSSCQSFSNACSGGRRRASNYLPSDPALAGLLSYSSRRKRYNLVMRVLLSSLSKCYSAANVTQRQSTSVPLDSPTYTRVNCMVFWQVRTRQVI